VSRRVLDEHLRHGRAACDKKTCLTPTAAGHHLQRGARAHSNQSREERTAELERGLNSEESGLEAYQRASLSKDEAVDTMDPKAMMTKAF
jgi:hypothetical protein